MNTLHIDGELLRRAEQQAQKQNINLNQLVEAFIRRFVQNPDNEKMENAKVTSFVERLGVDLDLPENFDEKEAYRKHLKEKYK